MYINIRLIKWSCLIDVNFTESLGHVEVTCGTAVVAVVAVMKFGSSKGGATLDRRLPESPAGTGASGNLPLLLILTPRLQPWTQTLTCITYTLYQINTSNFLIIYLVKFFALCIIIKHFTFYLFTFRKQNKFSCLLNRLECDRSDLTKYWQLISKLLFNWCLFVPISPRHL